MARMMQANRKRILEYLIKEKGYDDNDDVVVDAGQSNKYSTLNPIGSDGIACCSMM